MRTRANVLFQFMVLIALTGTGVVVSFTQPKKTTPGKMADSAQKYITVTGKAEHSKAAAIVITDNDEVYFIEGRHDWGKLYGKKVKVTGRLKAVTTTADDLKNEKGEMVQGMEGTANYIVKAKVQAVTE